MPPAAPVCNSMQVVVKWLWKQLCPSCGIFWCPATSWTVGCQIAHALITPMFSSAQILWASWSCCKRTATKDPHSVASWLSPTFCPLNMFFFFCYKVHIDCPLSHLLFIPLHLSLPHFLLTYIWPTFWLEVNPQREHHVSLAPCQFPHKMYPSSLYIFPVSPHVPGLVLF